MGRDGGILLSLQRTRTFRRRGGARAPRAGAAAPGAGHLLAEPDAASQAGHNATQLELHILLRSLQAGQGRLKGVDATFSTAQLQAEVADIGVGGVQGDLQVLALVLQFALRAARVIEGELVVLLFHGGIIDQFGHLALEVGEFLAQSFTRGFCLHNLTQTYKSRVNNNEEDSHNTPLLCKMEVQSTLQCKCA